MIGSVHGEKLSENKNEELLIKRSKLKIKMKKKIRAVMMVAAVALIAGVNVYHSQRTTEMSDMALANVEALANNENDLCPNGCYDNGDGCYCNVWFETLREAGPVI